MAGLEIAPDWLSVTWILGQFGDEFNASQLKFIEFVHQDLKRPSPWLELKGQILLGSDQFVSQLKHRLNTMIPEREITRNQLLPQRPDMEELF